MKSGRAILIAAAVFSLAAAPMAGGNGTGDDRGKNVPKDVVVEFGQAQPQSTDPVATHIVDPDDVSVREGGTVTFNVNGTNHGIAIYPVSANTTREDISEDLCQGGSTVCNGAAGTQNLAYHIIDGRHHLIIETDTGANQPRIDDPFHRYLSTSGSIPGQAVSAGAFLVGSTPTATGNRIQVRFTKAGRYLVVCQNRAHLLNDWMFGFVNVVENDDNDHK
jgi:plastocyanin